MSTPLVNTGQPTLYKGEGDAEDAKRVGGAEGAERVGVPRAQRGWGVPRALRAQRVKGGVLLLLPGVAQILALQHLLRVWPTNLPICGPCTCVSHAPLLHLPMCGSCTSPCVSHAPLLHLPMCGPRTPKPQNPWACATP